MLIEGRSLSANPIKNVETLFLPARHRGPTRAEDKMSTGTSKPSAYFLKSRRAIVIAPSRSVSFLVPWCDSRGHDRLGKVRPYRRQRFRARNQEPDLWWLSSSFALFTAPPCGR